MPKNNIEKIENIQAQIQQLENERKRLMQLQKEADRKARTKRLIERGAILESLISDADTFTNDQIKAFLEETITSDSARKILDRIAKQDEIFTPSKLTNVQSKDEFIPIVKSATTASGED